MQHVRNILEPTNKQNGISLPALVYLGLISSKLGSNVLKIYF